MIHFVPDSMMTVIEEMDKKIGEFMQRRADIVNRIISETAQFQAGEMVAVYDEGEHFLFYATVVQALFLKKQGIIAYRLKKQDGTMFTNEQFILHEIGPDELNGSNL